MRDGGGMQPRPAGTDLSVLVAGRSPTEHEKHIWATRTGLWVLILALLLQWIPLIEYLGLMVGGIGIFYVLRGRRAFGLRYERFVWASIILFAATETAAFALDQEFAYTLDVARYGYSGPAAAALAVGAYGGMAVGASAVAVFLALSYVLLAFDLEDRDGRWWLLTGLATQVVVSAVVCSWILLPLVQQSVTQAYLVSPPDSAILATTDAQIRGFSALRLLDLIPASLFAWAYTRAILRIDQGGVPFKSRSNESSGPS